MNEGIIKNQLTLRLKKFFLPVVAAFLTTLGGCSNLAELNQKPDFKESKTNETNEEVSESY